MRTNKEPGQRPYQLTPGGLAALRAAIARVRPWERSTGPRTPAGKAASARNATRNGRHSEAARARGRDRRVVLWVAQLALIGEAKRARADWAAVGVPAAELRRAFPIPRRIPKGRGFTDADVERVFPGLLQSTLRATMPNP